MIFLQKSKLDLGSLKLYKLKEELLNYCSLSLDKEDMFYTSCLINYICCCAVWLNVLIYVIWLEMEMMVFELCMNSSLTKSEIYCSKSSLQRRKGFFFSIRFKGCNAEHISFQFFLKYIVACKRSLGICMNIHTFCTSFLSIEESSISCIDCVHFFTNHGTKQLPVTWLFFSKLLCIMLI